MGTESKNPIWGMLSLRGRLSLPLESVGYTRPKFRVKSRLEI